MSNLLSTNVVVSILVSVHKQKHNLKVDYTITSSSIHYSIHTTNYLYVLQAESPNGPFSHSWSTYYLVLWLILYVDLSPSYGIYKKSGHCYKLWWLLCWRLLWITIGLWSSTSVIVIIVVSHSDCVTCASYPPQCWWSTITVYSFMWFLIPLILKLFYISR